MVQATAAAKSEVIVHSSQLLAERIELGAGEGIEWQRCPVSDRTIVVLAGSGHYYRSRDRDEVREDARTGDVLYAQRMVWHRVVAAPDHALTVAIVTHVPVEVEVRR